MKHEHEHEHEQNVTGCGCGHCRHAEDEHEHEHGEGENKKLQIIKLIVAAVIFIAALLCEHVIGTDLVVYLILYIAAFIAAGYDVVINAVKGIIRLDPLDECFLMTVASVGAFCIGEFAEAGAVMILYSLGVFLQDLAVDKSRESISELIDFAPKTAIVLRGGEYTEIDADDVEIGDTVVVKAGAGVPVDGTVTEGNTSVDTSALTGESMPRDITVGDKVMSGYLNQTGEIKIRAEALFSNSAASRIKGLIEGAEAKKAKTESFISKFAKVYTPVVVIIAVILAIVPPLFDRNWTEWIHRALTFLVVSCPCALVISVPLTFFAGLGSASRKGILVKGAEHLERLSKTEIFAFDKTGTLTKGVITVTAFRPTYDEKLLKDVICSVEAHSDHPIARAFHGMSYDKKNVTEIKEITGEGVTCLVDGVVCAVGNEKLMKRFGITVPTGDVTLVHAYLDGKHLGYAELSDTVKEEASGAIARLRALGVNKTVMLTGDTKTSAEKTAAALELSCVKASLLPEDKVSSVEELLKEGNTAYVGDGINDAAVLVRADTGIAMGTLGSDIAIEAADVVITDDDLTKLPEAVRISKKTVRIAWQNIVFAIAVKLTVLILSALGIADMMWIAVFADTGVALLCAANAMRAMR